MSDAVQVLKTLGDYFAKAASPYELASRGERHGSWEFVAQRLDRGVSRSVRLALTPLGRPDDSKAEIAIEVTAGAESGNHYHTDVISTSAVPASQVWSEGLQAKIWVDVQKAVERADGFAASDLDQEYASFPELRRA